MDPLFLHAKKYLFFYQHVVFSIYMSNLISNHIVIVTDNLMFVMCRVDMEDGGRGVEEGNRILNSAEVGARLISNLISIPIVMVYLCMCCDQLSAIAYPGQPQNSPSTPAALAPPGRCSRSVFDYFTDPSKIVHSSK